MCGWKWNVRVVVWTSARQCRMVESLVMLPWRHSVWSMMIAASPSRNQIRSWVEIWFVSPPPSSSPPFSKCPLLISVYIYPFFPVSNYNSLSGFIPSAFLSPPALSGLLWHPPPFVLTPLCLFSALTARFSEPLWPFHRNVGKTEQVSHRDWVFHQEFKEGLVRRRRSGRELTGERSGRWKAHKKGM